MTPIEAPVTLGYSYLPDLLRDWCPAPYGQPCLAGVVMRPWAHLHYPTYSRAIKAGFIVKVRDRYLLTEEGATEIRRKLSITA